MKTVDFQDADFSTLVDEAEAGEEIVIEKSGRPVARLLPPDKPHSRKGLGAFKGRIWIDDDKFDDPLPPDLLKAFGVEE